MPTKEVLLEKLCKTPTPKNFSKHELDSLMSKCGCLKQPGGRGSAVKYVKGSNKIIFDLPHPGKDLYRYQINLVIDFLRKTGDIVVKDDAKEAEGGSKK